MSVIRRNRVFDKNPANLTVGGADASDFSVPDKKMSDWSRYGSVRAGAAFVQTYKSFSRAFGGVPMVELSVFGNYPAITRLLLRSVSAGSFSFLASPGSPYIGYVAWGSNA